MSQLRLMCVALGFLVLPACVDDDLSGDLAYIERLAPAAAYRATPAERAFGQKLFRHILQNFGSYGQEIVGSKTNIAAARIIQHDELNTFVRGVLHDLPDGKLHTVILLDVSEIVHFGTPDGMIGLSLGAIQRTRNRDELAGLIVHELYAIKRRLLASMIKPTSAPTESQLQAAAEILLSKGFKPEVEMALDVDTWRLLSKTGFEPDEYLRMLERWSTEQAQDAFRILEATHPPLRSRVANLQAWKAKHGHGVGRDIPESPRLLKFWQQVLR